MILAPEDQPDLWCSASSEFYGHANLLRNFVGVHDRRLAICGALQHGWSVGVSAPVDARYTEACPLYVWNERSAAHAAAAGVEHVHMIGAPIVYAEWNIGVAREPASILALPLHSTTGHPFKSKRAAFADYAAWLESTWRDNALDSAAVCLHAADYADLSVRREFSGRGIKTVTCGYPLGSDDFLKTLFGYILAAEYVTSNAVTTPLIYGALAEKVAFVGGPVPELVVLAGMTGEQTYREASDPAWVAANFPEFLHGLDSKPAVETARREIGLAHRKTAADLWRLLRFMVQR